MEQIAVLDSGAPLVSETTAQALEELALLEGQTAAVHDSVVLLSALIEHGPPGAGTPPWSWPVSGSISSEFGSRGSPYGGGWEFHPGLDIRASAGTPVAATGAGTVMFAGWMHGYGNMVVIDHGFDLKTVYGHLSAVYADVGRQVREGGYDRRRRPDGPCHRPAPPLRGARRHRAGRSDVLPRRRRPQRTSAVVDHAGVDRYSSGRREPAVVGP